MTRLHLRPFAATLVLALSACGGGGYGGGSGVPMSTGQGFAAVRLDADATAVYTSTHADPNLVNGWGVAMNPSGFAWVADQATSKSTFYDGFGVPQSPPVTIPPGSGTGPQGPTGIVFNGSAGDFGGAEFVFATLGGTIAAWSPGVSLTAAATKVDNAANGSVYTGLALAAQGTAHFLYAANFANGRVDVFDAGFVPVRMAGAFTDPGLPAGYAPFGIQAIGGDRIVVAYAIPDPVTHEKRAAGLGVLDLYDSAGALVRRLVSDGGVLNAPWGIALAPADFGKFGGALLVGNFGDGRINAFDANTGALLGTLGDASGNPIVIDGLWGIAFGNGINDLATRSLFYAAGPADETHGTFGRIDPM
ncbi:MAG TPA: TIGR03118 family protein [Ideonella sp.]|nr:TIGR03118 family protein [Ideonella sp.]